MPHIYCKDVEEAKKRIAFKRKIYSAIPEWYNKNREVIKNLPTEALEFLTEGKITEESFNLLEFCFNKFWKEN
jgi:hypothetical protein